MKRGIRVEKEKKTVFFYNVGDFEFYKIENITMRSFIFLKSRYTVCSASKSEPLCTAVPCVEKK